MSKISEEQRRYLQELFKPFGIEYIIVHYSRGTPKLRVRSKIDAGIECEFGNIHRFLAMSRAEQIKRIKEKLPC